MAYEDNRFISHIIDEIGQQLGICGDGHAFGQRRRFAIPRQIDSYGAETLAQQSQKRGHRIPRARPAVDEQGHLAVWSALFDDVNTLTVDELVITLVGVQHSPSALHVERHHMVSDVLCPH